MVNTELLCTLHQLMFWAFHTQKLCKSPHNPLRLEFDIKRILQMSLRREENLHLSCCKVEPEFELRRL